jgi:hypothetical protein
MRCSSAAWRISSMTRAESLDRAFSFEKWPSQAWYISSLRTRRRAFSFPQLVTCLVCYDAFLQVDCRCCPRRSASQCYEVPTAAPGPLPSVRLSLLERLWHSLMLLLVVNRPPVPPPGNNCPPGNYWDCIMPNHSTARDRH